jgi:DNA-directed RNA polymerase subunit H (RpoH/RPB5)
MVDTLSTASFKEAVGLYNVRKTQLKLVRAQGYVIPEDEQKYVDLGARKFLDHYVNKAIDDETTIRKTLCSVYTSEDDDDDRLVVSYADVVGTKQLGVNEVAQFVKDMDNHDTYKGIIISANQMSSDANKNVDQLPTYDVQFFMEKELTYNVVDHILVPKHEFMDLATSKAFMAKYGLSPDNLPNMFSKDPVCRYYNGKVGQIVKIYRTNIHNTSVVETIYYRMIIDKIK